MDQERWVSRWDPRGPGGCPPREGRESPRNRRGSRCARSARSPLVAVIYPGRTREQALIAEYDAADATVDGAAPATPSTATTATT